ncbi:MAG: Gfo/Idh/MocA family oxidoreductase [Planctomycetes bacterium]|nr:Gfo/Idh/MocA family oxidoreductase [Planctomycetota bacterium]
MNHRRAFDRRTFVAQTITAGTVACVAPGILHGSNRVKELHVAAVGCNGMGWSDLSSVGSHTSVKFVGFCDIDENRFDQVDKGFPGVKHYSDYREMLSELGDRVDAVIVSTPDHMHAPVAMMAMGMGKHIYCQKPLTHTVWEARQMRLLATKKNLTTQMGNQIHSANEYRGGVRMIQEGKERGRKVVEVHSWVGVQGRQYCKRTDRPAEASPPANVHWDLWLGAAPWRPFAPDVYHPFKWRDWQDFGSGALGDFACHILDPVFTALQLTAPTSIVAQNEGTTREVWPGPEKITFTFPGTQYTSGKELKVVWYDGGLKPSADFVKLPEGKELPGAGSLFVCENGDMMVLPHVGAAQWHRNREVLKQDIPMGLGTNHWHDWVNAVLEGKKTTDGFEYAGPLTEAVQLGNIATRLPGATLKWDAVAFQLEGHADAQGMLTKSYTKGFEVNV